LVPHHKGSVAWVVCGGGAPVWPQNAYAIPSPAHSAAHAIPSHAAATSTRSSLWSTCASTASSHRESRQPDHGRTGTCVTMLIVWSRTVHGKGVTTAPAASGRAEPRHVPSPGSSPAIPCKPNASRGDEDQRRDQELCMALRPFVRVDHPKNVLASTLVIGPNPTLVSPAAKSPFWR
jgi:hypothetical protein